VPRGRVLISRVVSKTYPVALKKGHVKAKLFSNDEFLKRF
jgi:hypothetical protein